MGTKHRGSPEEVRALDLNIKLMRCAQSLDEKLRCHVHRAGFSGHQFGVLEVLYHLGPLKPAVLGKKLFTSRPNVTQILDALERRSLVERRRCDGDRRQIDVHLTDEGRAVIQPLFAEHVRAVVGTMAVLSAEEQETLSALLKRLGLQKAPPRDTSSHLP